MSGPIRVSYTHGLVSCDCEPYYQGNSSVLQGHRCGFSIWQFVQLHKLLFPQHTHKTHTDYTLYVMSWSLKRSVEAEVIIFASTALWSWWHTDIENKSLDLLCSVTWSGSLSSSKWVFFKFQLIYRRFDTDDRLLRIKGALFFFFFFLF